MTWSMVALLWISSMMNRSISAGWSQMISTS